MTFSGAGQLESEWDPYTHAAVVPETASWEIRVKSTSGKTILELGEKGGEGRGAWGPAMWSTLKKVFEEEPGRGIRSAFWQPHLPWVSKAGPSQHPSSSLHPRCLKKLSRGPMVLFSDRGKAGSQAKRPCHLTSPRCHGQSSPITQPHLTNAHCICVHLLISPRP